MFSVFIVHVFLLFRQGLRERKIKKKNWSHIEHTWNFPPILSAITFSSVTLSSIQTSYNATVLSSLIQMLHMCCCSGIFQKQTTQSNGAVVVILALSAMPTSAPLPPPCRHLSGVLRWKSISFAKQSERPAWHGGVMESDGWPLVAGNRGDAA